ncbi:MAG: hypothetical protein ABEJ42_01425 [Halobacteriaceae archaeon]
MSGSAAARTEPVVLAHAKRRLFPSGGGGPSDVERGPDADGATAGSGRAYAVVDTQFATDRWLADQPVAASTREALAPFNHVRVGGGYPDLVGVRRLESELLAVDRSGEEPPLVAVEAKGETGDGTVDTGRGVRQAHDRLDEANAAFLAAPSDAVSGRDRALARELNVGVLGVEAGGAVAVLERPRAVGTRTSEGSRAIRFQATAQGVADRSFGLNHPKNYLGYALAVHHAGETASLVDDHVVGAVDDARRGASFLGLVETGPSGVSLTGLGDEVVRFGVHRHGSVAAALEEVETWRGATARFCDAAPAWGQLARRVLWHYPATELLVRELQTMHRDGIRDPSLVDLVEWLHVQHPTFTVELFLRGTESARSRALGPDGELRGSALADGAVYHAPTVFQLKAMLYHAGILTERGAEPHRLDPIDDGWQLRTALDR